MQIWWSGSEISTTLQQQECSRLQNRHFGSQRHGHAQTRHSGASIDPVRGFRTLQEVQRRGQWKAFSSFTRYHKSSRLAADYHSLPCPFRDRLETSRATCQGIVDKATASLAAHKRITGKCMIDVFGGSGFLTKATNHSGLRGTASCSH